MGNWQGPMLVGGGGGFNLVRFHIEKSNEAINYAHANAFNEWINRWGPIEISDPSRSFSWTNNQKAPILAKLDRILVLVEWELKFPEAKVVQLPRGVSDHNPLKVTFGMKTPMKECCLSLKNGG
jgi:endonuclease/exonuclease/phosphatase family metal-dependent hydrolase